MSGSELSWVADKHPLVIPRCEQRRDGAVTARAARVGDVIDAPCPATDCDDGWWYCDIEEGRWIKQACPRCNGRGTVRAVLTADPEQEPVDAATIIHHRPRGWACTATPKEDNDDK